MATCAPNAKCLDTERSYKCICGQGFAGDGRSIDAGGTGCEGTNFLIYFFYIFLFFLSTTVIYAIILFTNDRC